jgi:hypothetical protein
MIQTLSGQGYFRQQQDGREPEEREPIEIKITVREPASKEIPEEYLIDDEGQEEGREKG